MPGPKLLFDRNTKLYFCLVLDQMNPSLLLLLIAKVDINPTLKQPPLNTVQVSLQYSISKDTVSKGKLFKDSASVRVERKVPHHTP